MSESQRVGAAAELAVVRLVNECRDLGDDAAVWQLRLVAGLIALTGGQVAAVGPMSPRRDYGIAGVGRWSETQTDGGWPSETVRARFLDWAADPAKVARHPGVARFFARPEADLTATRPELLPDSEWEASDFVHEFLRPCGLDEGMVSRAEVPAAGASYVLTVIRGVGGRPFGPRERAVVEAVQRELAPHLGRSLWLTHQPSRCGLTPRVAAVLDCLLDGDSEKQAAVRLGIGVATVHGHVKRLYAHFEVRSRAELLAYFLGRYRR